MPPNMPSGWAAMRTAFPPEIRDPFEAAYLIAYPGDSSKWKDDITWNFFQVLRLQTAMQAYVNEATEQQVVEIRALKKEIKDASLVFTTERNARNESSLHLLQAAQVIRDAEVTRKDYEARLKKEAIPLGKLLIAALVWSTLTLVGAYFSSSYATGAAIQRELHYGEPPPGAVVFPGHGHDDR
jgi:hypothetical protein